MLGRKRNFFELYTSMISNKVLAIQIFLVSNSAYIFTVTPDEYCGQEKNEF